MKKEVIQFVLNRYDSLDALTQVEQELLLKAHQARKNAYAPYSDYQVGAAMLLANGEVVIGSNQENASYPSGLCAERVAVFQAGARFPGVAIKHLAIAVGNKNSEQHKPAAPCGNCRQSLFEYEHRQGHPISVLMQAESGPIFQCSSIADILPLAFDSSYL